MWRIGSLQQITKQTIGTCERMSKQKDKQFYSPQQLVCHLKEKLQESGLDGVVKEHALNCKRHSVHKNLVLLHYDTMNSEFRSAC